MSNQLVLNMQPDFIRIILHLLELYGEQFGMPKDVIEEFANYVSGAEEEIIVRTISEDEEIAVEILNNIAEYLEETIAEAKKKNHKEVLERLINLQEYVNKEMSIITDYDEDEDDDDNG